MTTTLRLRTVLKALAALALIASAQPALACDLRIDTGNVLIGGGGSYDPLADTHDTAIIDVVVSRDEAEDEDCNFSLTVRPVVPLASSTDWFLRQGTDALKFTLARDAAAARILRPVATATPNNTISGRIPAGSNEARLQLFALVEPGQLVPPGSYEAPIELEVSTTGFLAATQEVSIGTIVRGSAAIAMTNGSASRILDFEELQQDERLGTRLSVQSNVVYFLSITSENQGRLKREGAVGSNDYDYVGYTAYLDNRAVTNLAQRATLGPFSPQTQEHDTQFQIGSVERKRAGTYSDFVTIEVRLIN